MKEADATRQAASAFLVLFTSGQIIIYCRTGS